MGLPADMGVGWIDMDPYGDFYRATVYPVLQVCSDFFCVGPGSNSICTLIKLSEPKTLLNIISNYFKMRV